MDIFRLTMALSFAHNQEQNDDQSQIGIALYLLCVTDRCRRYSELWLCAEYVDVYAW